MQGLEHLPVRDADFKELGTFGEVSLPLVKIHHMAPGMQGHALEAFVDENLLRGQDDLSPQPLALMRGFHGHLLELSFRGRDRNGLNTSDDPLGGTEESEVKVVHFGIQVFVVKAQPQRFTQNFVPKRALGAVFRGAVGDADEAGYCHAWINVTWR